MHAVGRTSVDGTALALPPDHRRPADGLCVQWDVV